MKDVCPDPSAPFLSVRHIRKSYASPHGAGWFSRHQHHVLEDISFDMAQGEMVGLLGESGCGKSTLARILLGLEQPDSGAVLFEGQRLQQWRARRPGRMSVVFQDYMTSVNPSFSVHEIIAEGLHSGGQRRQAERTSIRELMARMQLEPGLEDKLPHQLSGGQVQRVCMARALASQPDFIVFDEALSALDISVQAQILDLLRSVRDGMTGLFITHDIQTAAAICDRLVLLHRGKTVASVRDADSMDSSLYFRDLLHTAVIFESDFENSQPGE